METAALILAILAFGFVWTAGMAVMWSWAIRGAGEFGDESGQDLTNPRSED